MVKYKEYFQKMREENQDLFANFKLVHDLYSKDKFANQQEFNKLGVQVRKVVEEWDTKLCGRMESGQHASYSSRLSEKFWGEVRQLFPLIDFVGVTVRRAKSP